MKEILFQPTIHQLQEQEMLLVLLQTRVNLQLTDQLNRATSLALRSNFSKKEINELSSP